MLVANDHEELQRRLVLLERDIRTCITQQGQAVTYTWFISTLLGLIVLGGGMLTFLYESHTNLEKHTGAPAVAEFRGLQGTVSDLQRTVHALPSEHQVREIADRVDRMLETVTNIRTDVAAIKTLLGPRAPITPGGLRGSRRGLLLDDQDK